MATAIIKNKLFKAKVSYPSKGNVKINKILPFRVRFSSIGIENESGSNVPPIPLQIIGFSNYIL